MMRCLFSAFVGFIFLIVPAIAFSQPAPVASRTIALVIAPDQFRDEEFFIPKQALEKAGFATIVASTRLGQAKGMLDGTADVTITINALNPANLAGLVIVGGAGSPTYLWDHPPLHALAADLFKQGKPVAAICLSPVVLAKAKLLSGRKATVYPDPKAIQELHIAGAHYVDQPCISDRSLITANGPDAASVFAIELIKLLK